ncbi:MAG: GntR family transcriptional regulator [Pseudonocardiaceae bacterium]
MGDLPAKPSRYAEVAAELRDEILSGRLPPGVALPSENRLAAQRGVSRDILRAALAVLRSEGLITTIKGGSTYIRDRRVVRLSLSQYSRTLHPGPPAPFSAAAQAAGLVGNVRVVQVERRPADADVARGLDIPEGDMVIVRARHMLLDDVEPETVQISSSMIPLALVEGSPLAADAPLRVYAAFVELGITPTAMNEEVSTRMPTPEEAETLGLVSGMPVLDIRRVTRDQDGRPIELLRVVATGDRTVLVYDDLPITPATN